MAKLGKYVFNKKRVISATEKAERRVLRTIGSYIRVSARQSIRERKTVSLPGKPPRSKTGFLKNSILFDYDPFTSSVVIGPARHGKRGTVPPALEYGGTTRNPKPKRQQQVKPRPFMGPAAAKNLPKLPAMWRDSIR